MNAPSTAAGLRRELVEQLAPSLRGKRILLGITGSIAAFKACDVLRLLKESGAEVRCVLTESGARFVTPLTLETLSGHPVATSLWPCPRDGGGHGTHHIDSARWADLACVAPASANFLGKLAHGLADDLLSTELLAFQGPVAVAPAMNPAMYASAAVQANVELLRGRGVRFLGPVSGATACGEQGEGRMLEPDEVCEGLARAFYRPPTGRRCLITLGPTRSYLDPVRYLTNRSSGLMGASMAWAAARAGYEVFVVAGPTQALLPSGISVHRVESSREMLAAAEALFDRADVLVASAAVLDWEARETSRQKLKREEGKPPIELEASPDLLATLCARKQPGQFVLGFAAETQDVVGAGAGKRARKNCDAVFANDVSLPGQGFEARANAGWWITARGTQEISLRPKALLAGEIIRLVDQEVERAEKTGARAP